MGGHGIWRHVEPPRDLTRGQPLRLMAHQKAEHLKAGSLRQCTKSSDGRSVIHMSRIVEIWLAVNAAVQKGALVASGAPGAGRTPSGTPSATGWVGLLCPEGQMSDHKGAALIKRALLSEAAQ